MKMNKKGFTLAELLIVIAIMAILIAIAIPVFSAQLEKARHAVDQSTMRSARSLAEAHYLLEHSIVEGSAPTAKMTFGEDGEGNLSIVTCDVCVAASKTIDDFGISGATAYTKGKCSKCTSPLALNVTNGVVTKDTTCTWED